MPVALHTLATPAFQTWGQETWVRGLGPVRAIDQWGSLAQCTLPLGPQSPHPMPMRAGPWGTAPTFLVISSWKSCSTESRRWLLQLE